MRGSQQDVNKAPHCIVRRLLSAGLTNTLHGKMLRQGNTDAVGRRPKRSQLRQYLQAVALISDHALHSPRLPFNAPHSGQHIVLDLR